MLTWDESGTRRYETGTDRGVLYPYDSETKQYTAGIAWNGLTGVTDSPEGGDPNDIWADNMKYGTIRGAETAGGTIEAYTYPDEFELCDGSAEISNGITIGQQERQTFGFCYRSMIGNDMDPNEGYKIHIYYGCTCSPSSKDYATINDNPDAIQFSWDFTANPVNVTNHKPTATLVIDSTKVSANTLTAIENALYNGTTLPLPDDILDLVTP